jgi:nitrite reductase/ring-hydroxylating ferredoxin subunit
MNGAPQRVMARPAPRPDRVDRLCGVDEVPEGEVKRVKVEGRPPLAVFNIGGEFFVTDDTCTHGMASLAEGLVEDGVVECPWHGGAFDIRTGAPLRHPCTVALRCYAVEVRDGAVYAGPARKMETGGGQA